ncbi:MAG: hypothetical protein J7J42_01790 [Thermoplasmata archaeon]|nr:hypothetical protein [Thermoplasmata archaeon]
MQEVEKIYMEISGEALDLWDDNGQWDIRIGGIRIQGDIVVTEENNRAIITAKDEKEKLYVEIGEDGYLLITAKTKKEK